MREAKAASARRRTLVLVNLTSMLEKADEVLLPAVYREVGLALGVSVTALGSLTLCRALVQALSFPLAAYASARHDRARVVAVGAFLWAAATFLVAISRTYLQVSSASRHPPSPIPLLPQPALTTWDPPGALFQICTHQPSKCSGYPNIPL
jgi:predicted MFS family arabinose efflux permease